MAANAKEGRLWLALSRFHVLDLFSRGCCWTHSCIVVVKWELSSSDFPLHIEENFGSRTRSFERCKVKRNKTFRWTKISDKYVFIWLWMAYERSYICMSYMQVKVEESVCENECMKCAHFFAHISKTVQKVKKVGHHKFVNL